MINLIKIAIFLCCFPLLSFEPFTATPNENVKKRIDFRKEIISTQEDLNNFASNRYGNFGREALTKLEQICEGYKVLIAFPGIILNIDKFEDFINTHNYLRCLDPWIAAQLFSEALGKKIVFRALVLSKDDFAAIQKNGILSEALRQNQELSPYYNFSFPMELLRRVRSEIKLFPELPDRTLSLSPSSDIAYTVAMGFAEPQDIGKKDLYIFKIELPTLENLYISSKNTHLCKYPKRSNEEIPDSFIIDNHLARPILCKAALFPKEIESFAEYLIEPDEIKEFKKISLSIRNIHSAKGKLNSIIQKQVCTEVDELHKILKPSLYKYLKMECRKYASTLAKFSQ